MTAPERIWVGFRGVATHQMDMADSQYILATPAALAFSTEVQALVMAERERCAVRMDLVAQGYHDGGDQAIACGIRIAAAAIRAGTEVGA